MEMDPGVGHVFQIVHEHMTKGGEAILTVQQPLLWGSICQNIRALRLPHMYVVRMFVRALQGSGLALSSAPDSPRELREKQQAATLRKLARTTSATESTLEELAMRMPPFEDGPAADEDLSGNRPGSYSGVTYHRTTGR